MPLDIRRMLISKTHKSTKEIQSHSLLLSLKSVENWTQLQNDTNQSTKKFLYKKWVFVHISCLFIQWKLGGSGEMVPPYHYNNSIKFLKLWNISNTLTKRLKPKNKNKNKCTLGQEDVSLPHLAIKILQT